MKTAKINETDMTVEVDGKIYKIGKEVPNKPTPEERFLELIKGEGLRWDFKEYPNSLFWFKDGSVIMEYDKKNNILWVSYQKIWSFFETEYSYNFYQIRGLCSSLVEKHFNLKATTTGWNITLSVNRWRNISI